MWFFDTNDDINKVFSSSLPVLYFYWSLYPVAAIVLSGGFIVSILLPIVSFSNHRPRLERYRFSPAICLYSDESMSKQRYDQSETCLKKKAYKTFREVPIGFLSLSSPFTIASRVLLTR